MEPPRHFDIIDHTEHALGYFQACRHAANHRADVLFDLSHVDIVTTEALTVLDAIGHHVRRLQGGLSPTILIPRAKRPLEVVRSSGLFNIDHAKAGDAVNSLVVRSSNPMGELRTITEDVTQRFEELAERLQGGILAYLPERLADLVRYRLEALLARLPQGLTDLFGMRPSELPALKDRVFGFFYECALNAREHGVGTRLADVDWVFTIHLVTHDPPRFKMCFVDLGVGILQSRHAQFYMERRPHLPAEDLLSRAVDGTMMKELRTERVLDGFGACGKGLPRILDGLRLEEGRSATIISNLIIISNEVIFRAETGHADCFGASFDGTIVYAELPIHVT